MTQRIDIFGEIGSAVTAEGIKWQLDLFDKAQPITVGMNTEGGAVGEAIAIYNLLRLWPAGVTVEIVGWVLSSGTLIAMAGKPIRAHETALLMVHAPWLSTSGNADHLRERAATLDQVAETMQSAYKRTGQADAVTRGWLDGADHWFTADQALAAGLIDEVIPAAEVVTSPVNASACRFPIPVHVQERIHAMSATATPPNQDAIRAEGARAEAARRDEIENAFARFNTAGARPEIAALLARCLRDVTVTPAAAKEQLLAALGRDVTPANPNGGAFRSPMGGAADQVVEFVAAARDTLLMRAGIRPAEPHPAARDLTRLSIVGMAERILSMNGRSTRDMGRAEVINAALSTSDFPSLLAAVTGKALRAGYESAAATHAPWTAEREVADFKAQTMLALSEAPGLELVREHAEYKRGIFSDSASPFQVETFGRIVGISRQALINDDLNAFTGIPKAFGASARRLEADKVYAVLTANAVLGDGVALFHADHANLAASGGALSLTTLGAARAAMRAQKGPAGLGYVDPMPRFLVVPVALETLAEQLVASTVDPSKSNDAQNPEWIRRLTVIADPRLDAASATAWYLAASPTQIEGILRAYLAGEDRPYLEENSEFERDVTSWKSRLDFGVGVIDFRALYKNPGA